MIAEMQAKIARFVGTHPGSPIELVPMQELGVELIPAHALMKGMRKLRSTKRSLSPRDVQAKLLKQAPETAVAQLDDVQIMHASILGREAMTTVALALLDPTLDAETVDMNAAVDRTVGVSPPIHKYRFLKVAQVGHEYAHGAKQLLNESLSDIPEPTISLDPLRIGRAVVSLRHAS